jgi:hypothetical protein
MARAILLPPSAFATWISTIGMFGRWGDEPIKLNQYVSGSHENGFNYTSDGLQNQIVRMKSVAGPTMGQGPAKNTKQWANIGKGQGYVADFIQVWEWIYDNFDAVQKLKVDLKHDEKDGKGSQKTVVERIGVPMSEFLTSKSDFATGMQKFIAKRGYGWDCIGFVFNYLYQINVYTAYPGYLPHQYLKVGSGFSRTWNLQDVQPLSLLIFGTPENGYHIVIVDSIQSYSASEVKLTIAQCSSGGPQYNQNIRLLPTQDKGFFQLSGPSPVQGRVFIATNPQLQAVYPNSKPGGNSWLDLVA